MLNFKKIKKYKKNFLFLMADAYTVLVTFISCAYREWAIACVVASIGFMGFYTPGSMTSMVGVPGFKPPPKKLVSNF
jgi:hypothetical protein